MPGAPSYNCRRGVVALFGMTAPPVSTDSLARIPAGPALSAALASCSLSLLTGGQAVDVLVARSRQLAHEQGEFAAIVAEVNRCREPDAMSRAQGPDEFSADEVRAALVLSQAMARALSLGALAKT